MPISTASNSRLKAACSVSEMASMVRLSRARFYELVDRGIFTPPVYSVTTKRPFFQREMQLRNIEVRQEQIGINGEIILFYEPRKPPTCSTRPSRRSRRSTGNSDLVSRLMPQLQSLGLGGNTNEVVVQAVAATYPEGVGETPEPEVLRAVYRHLRRQSDV